MEIVRVVVEADKAQSLLGATRAAAVALEPIWITDITEEKHFPIGWAWPKSDGALRVGFVEQRSVGLRSAKELPLSEMNRTDTLYLYFQVPKDKGAIKSFHMGSRGTQEITPPLKLN